jgi:hypothetical protein
MERICPKAVSENLELKKRIFSELAAETRPDTILATNTSSISITKIASSAVPQGESPASALGKSSAGRVVGKSDEDLTRQATIWTGLHFFNPVPVMVSCINSMADGHCVEPQTEIGRADLGITNVGRNIVASARIRCRVRQRSDGVQRRSRFRVQRLVNAFHQ